MSEFGPANVLRPGSAAYKLGKGIIGQVQRRSVIRKALAEGALRYALKFTNDQPGPAREFESIVDSLLRRRAGGAKPKGIYQRTVSLFRGGPATLFDGPEAIFWEDRVQALGEEALAISRQQLDGKLGAIVRTTKDVDGRGYLEAVKHRIADLATDDTSPSFGLNQEILQATELSRLRRKNTPTRLTVILATVVGIVGGAAAVPLVDMLTANAPGWAGPVAGATLGGAIAAARMASKGAGELAREAQERMQDLKNIKWRILDPLRRLTDTLVGVIDRSLSTQASTDLAIRHAVRTAFELLDGRISGPSHQARLEVGEDQRAFLRRFADDLTAAGRSSGLNSVDPVAGDAVNRLGRGISELIGAEPRGIEEELQLGKHFVNALMNCCLIEARMITTPAEDVPEPKNVKTLLVKFRRLSA